MVTGQKRVYESDSYFRLGTRQRFKGFRVRSRSRLVEGYLFSTEKLAENWQMLDDFEGFQYQRVTADIEN